MDNLLAKLIIAVYQNPGLTGREINAILSRDGFYVTRTDVNRVLYREKTFFWREVDQNLKPSWYLLDAIHTQITAMFQSPASTPYPSVLKLYPWQEKALVKWEEADCVGVVEAVTGTGKTRVALAAIEKHIQEGWKTAIIVPTIELQNQWTKVIQTDLIEPSKLKFRVGHLGGGSNDTLDNCDVLITTAASACSNNLHTGDYNGLLIADECHRYGAENWARGLEDKFKRRLGLTATYEREDDGKEKYLDPYFNSVCYTLGYEEALVDGVIANFKVAFIGFDFNASEQEAYEKHNNNCTKYKKELIDIHGVTPEPFGEFMREVSYLSSGGGDKATIAARYYINSFSKRRQLLSNCTHKNAGLAKLAPAIEKADRTIIFTQTVDAAGNAVNLLNSAGFNAAMLDATMNRNERKEILVAFEDGINDIVAAPMLLDEGIDVPAADLAIIVASSRNKRQMIQRMGRVLRKKKDNRLARIAIFYIKGTSEDPERGAHGTYIDLIRDPADEVKLFDIADHRHICEYLNDWNSNPFPPV